MASGWRTERHHRNSARSLFHLRLRFRQVSLPLAAFAINCSKPCGFASPGIGAWPSRGSSSTAIPVVRSCRMLQRSAALQEFRQCARAARFVRDRADRRAGRARSRRERQTPREEIWQPAALDSPIRIFLDELRLPPQGRGGNIGSSNKLPMLLPSQALFERPEPQSILTLSIVVQPRNWALSIVCSADRPWRSMAAPGHANK